MQSSSSVCYSVAKIESDLGGPSRMIGSGIGSPVPSNLQFGIRKQSERLSASALKVGKESHRIRKPPLPLPQVQYRPPIIIHTYSPKVIHTEPDDFMSLVQKLTGSSDTRLRLKRNLSAKKGAKSGDRTKVDTTDLEQQGSKDARCGSPAPVSEESTFLTSDACGSVLAMKQSDSPKSPLDSNFEFENHDLLFTTFDVKTEPSSFSFNDNSFNFFSDFNPQPASAASRASNLPAKTGQIAQEPYNSFPSIDINSSLPSQSGSYFTTGPMASLPDFSQSFLDCFTGAPAPPQRQGHFNGGYSSSSESTMVALENIQAFMLH
ncbi:uncharacterized protein [Physcomitrium patens]|uniref:VQ domain-containing protein n=1 Tax=Physcomitrium patens TaxID=3218 RepID=A9REB4_PHYPA|nr:uncharacterized protein LOC112293694 [Physcomitrium patens]PNR38243.1 hypothetical protein PHYPA_021354 [Physcomitrium patens]|eukprot:XP_024399178.1 uncharacterized protein LOC112293694 [Physcomitrella patens]